MALNPRETAIKELVELDHSHLFSFYAILGTSKGRGIVQNALLLNFDRVGPFSKHLLW